MKARFSPRPGISSGCSAFVELTTSVWSPDRSIKSPGASNRPFAFSMKNFRLYQYLIKTHAKPIEYGKSELPVVQEALGNRAAYVNSKRLHRVELYWAVVYEGCRFGRNGNSLASFLGQPGKRLERLLSTERTVEDLGQ